MTYQVIFGRLISIDLQGKKITIEEYDPARSLWTGVMTYEISDGVIHALKRPPGEETNVREMFSADERLKLLIKDGIVIDYQIPEEE